MQVRRFKEDHQKAYFQKAEAFYHSNAAVGNITRDSLKRVFREIMKDSPYVKGMMVLKMSRLSVTLC